MARATGIAESRISEVLSGKRQLTEQIMKLAAYFHVQPGVFLSQSGQAWSNGVQSAGPHSRRPEQPGRRPMTQEEMAAKIAQMRSVDDQHEDGGSANVKYFTREQYLAMQNSDKASLDAADADWEKSVQRYDAYLQMIRPEMPEPVRQLLDGFHLHDARVLSMGRRGNTFVISLQLDVPPNDLLHITYALAGPPEVKQEIFPWVKEVLSSGLAVRGDRVGM